MIYQMTVYYGAMLNNQVIYSSETTFNDCNMFPDKIDEYMFKYPIEQAILNDGFNLSDFKIGYLTKEQYDNRFEIENEKTVSWTIEKSK